MLRSVHLACGSSTCNAFRCNVRTVRRPRDAQCTVTRATSCCGPSPGRSAEQTTVSRASRLSMGRTSVWHAEITNKTRYFSRHVSRDLTKNTATLERIKMRFPSCEHNNRHVGAVAAGNGGGSSGSGCSGGGGDGKQGRIHRGNRSHCTASRAAFQGMRRAISLSLEALIVASSRSSGRLSSSRKLRIPL